MQTNINVKMPFYTSNLKVRVSVAHPLNNNIINNDIINTVFTVNKTENRGKWPQLLNF